MQAEAEAAAIQRVNEALAASLKLLNEACPNDQVIKLKALEAFRAAADGRATKIIIPSEIQGLAGLAGQLRQPLGRACAVVEIVPVEGPAHVVVARRPQELARVLVPQALPPGQQAREEHHPVDVPAAVHAAVVERVVVEPVVRLAQQRILRRCAEGREHLAVLPPVSVAQQLIDPILLHGAVLLPRLVPIIPSARPVVNGDFQRYRANRRHRRRLRSPRRTVRETVEGSSPSRRAIATCDSPSS